MLELIFFRIPGLLLHKLMLVVSFLFKTVG